MVNKGSASLPESLTLPSEQIRWGLGGHSGRQSCCQPASGPLHLDPNAGGKVESEVQESKEL